MRTDRPILKKQHWEQIPIDSASLFSITEGLVQSSTGKIQLTWPSVTGIRYRIWNSPDLTGWSPARDWAAAQTPPEELAELDLTPSNAFFKVEAEI